MPVRGPERARPGTIVLGLGALGVVFGDIGTSPLYALQTVFAIDGGLVKATPGDVYGVISMVFWSIMVVVSLKYVVLVMRSDNDGEGGVMALAALTHRSVRPGGRRFTVVMLLGVVGAALFYGDSVITPAISVLSAVEGLAVPAPGLASVVLPVGVVILAALFAVQRYGTQVVGRLFGPIMVLWFVILGVLGLRALVSDPAIVLALWPGYAVGFVVDHPGIAFVAMGAVVLAITGAEALYADMGHFGRTPIRTAWFVLVLPCLTLNYLGQGALILQSPSAVSSPFFRLAPDWAQLALVVLATAATVIASQAVISGAFSVSRQAERLGYLPRLTVRQTSRHESGQIYVPSINWLLFGGVMLLLLVFRSSDKLATAYGLAVTGTFLLTTVLFLVHAQAAWTWPAWKLVVTGVLFGGLELSYFAANLTKVVHGGWLPLVIAAIVVVVMLTWQRGRVIVTERRRTEEGDLAGFLQGLESDPPQRVPGTAVFLHPADDTVPLALRENVLVNKVLHEKVVILATRSAKVPHVEPEDRITVSQYLGSRGAITHVTCLFGFQDDQDVPASLALARGQGLDLDPDRAYYFLSRITVQRSALPGMSLWRKRLFIALAHNAANPTEYFRLPHERTIVMGTWVDV